MTQLTYDLARTLAGQWSPRDEVVVTVSTTTPTSPVVPRPVRRRDLSCRTPAPSTSAEQTNPEQTSAGGGGHRTGHSAGPDGRSGHDGDVLGATRRSLDDLLGDCVHCGFCLPTCPTYVLWGEEMDSPRGRIHLIDQVQHGAPMSDEVVEHLDACLGCMACVTACPSGVQYDQIIETARVQVEERHQRPPRQRLLREAIFAVFPYPHRLRAMRGPLASYQ